MPRKVRVSASRDENRQAQQRSRARHRDYVASLESRIREYEQQGVQATLEMQRAAQAVSAKNERLLALLTLHGVQQHEIDAFLSAPNDIEAGPRFTDQVMELPPAATTSPCTPKDLLIIHEPPLLNNSRAAVPALRQGTQTSGCSKTSKCEPIRAGVDRPESQVCNPFSKRSLTESSVERSNDNHANREVTSCEMAASIIVNLRGHGDVAEARQTLGCADSTSCSVKNTHLFQLMNELP